MKALNFNRLLFLVIGGTVSIIFISCGLQKIELTILGEDNPTMSAIKEVSDNYKSQNKSNVNLNFAADPYAVMIVKAQNDLAAGLGVHDIILEYNTALSNYARNDYVYTINELKEKMVSTSRDKSEIDKAFSDISNNLYTNAWKETGWYSSSNDTRSQPIPVGFPHTANTMFLAYNSKLFGNVKNKADFKAKYGYELLPPKTWQEYSDVAAFFTPGDNSTFGVCMQGDEYWIYYEWANFAYSQGGGVFNKQYGWEGDENTPMILSSRKTIKATKKWLEMKKYQSDKVEFFASNASEQLKCLRYENAAMGIIWSDVAYDLVKDDLNKDPKNRVFSFSPIPGNSSMLAGGSFYINKKTNYPVVVADYILWLLEYDTQKDLALRGLCSPNKNIYDDKEIISRIPYTVALKESLDRGRYMLEAGPDAEPIILILSSTLQRLWTSGNLSNVETALIDAENEIREKRKEIFSYIGKN